MGVLNGEAARRAKIMGIKDAPSLMREDDKRWHELNSEEKDDDPFSGYLLGPLHAPKTATSRFSRTSGPSRNVAFHYDLENDEYLWTVPQGKEVLHLTEVAMF